MKNKVITGNFDGRPIWRDETPEETLIREMKDNGNKKSGNQIVSVAKLYIEINETWTKKS